MFILGVTIVLRILWAPSALPVPEEVFPGEGTITGCEISRGVLPEFDAGIDGIIDRLPEEIAFQGRSISIPPGSLALLRRSGPWRCALWESEDGERFALLVGGEGFGRVRGRVIRSVARSIESGSGLSAVSIAGGLLIGNEVALVRECALRAEEAPRRRIPRGGVRFWQDDARAGVALELWWWPKGDRDLLLERWRGRSTETWQEVFLDRGIRAELLDEKPEERMWELHGARDALREFLGSIQRW